MSLINTQILPFTTQAFHNGEFVEVSQDDVPGKWAIFFIYPGDFTFVCPTELGDLADHYEQLQEMGVEVYSVSTDSHFVHKAWQETSEHVGKVRYYMLGDSTGDITRNFQNMREGVSQADRATFLVDPEGTIQYIEQTAEGIGRDASVPPGRSLAGGLPREATMPPPSTEERNFCDGRQRASCQAHPCGRRDGSLRLREDDDRRPGGRCQVRAVRGCR